MYPSHFYSDKPRSTASSRILLPTDIINIDVTLYTSLPSPASSPLPLSTHGDSSITFCLPEVDEQGRELVEITQEALDIGIKQCGPGRKFRDIGCAIECVHRACLAVLAVC